MKNQINIYTEHDFDCSCGRHHHMPIGEVSIGTGVAKKLPEAVLRLSLGKKGLLVTDEIIFDSLGHDVFESWHGQGLEIGKYILQGRVHPDEDTIGRVICNVPLDTEFIISIGGGTVTDIVRYVATRLKLPGISIPSAMTMDGFFTNMSVIVINGLQRTYYIDYPKVILADTQIIAKAPPVMNAAGVGEVVSKISASMDLYAAYLMKGVYYCQNVNDMMNECISEGTDRRTVDGLPGGDNEAVRLLTDSLYKSAVGMAWYGNSQCGSGAEHQLNHFWMMCQDNKGIPQSMHGQAVGIGAVINMMVWEQILSIDFDTFDIDQAVENTWDKKEWTEEIKRIYGAGAKDILQLQEGNHSFDKTQRRKELEKIVSCSKEMRRYYKTLPSPEQISEILQKCGGPNSPKEINLDREDVVNGIYYAKEMRAGRYNALWIAEALGILDRVSKQIGTIFYSEG